MFSVNPSDITFTNPIIIKFFNTYKNHPTLLTNLHITISASSKDTNTSYILPIRPFRIFRLPYLLSSKDTNTSYILPIRHFRLSHNNFNCS